MSVCRRGAWYFSKTINGVRHKCAVKTAPNKVQAEQAEATFILQLQGEYGKQRKTHNASGIRGECVHALVEVKQAFLGNRCRDSRLYWTFSGTSVSVSHIHFRYETVPNRSQARRQLEYRAGPPDRMCQYSPISSLPEGRLDKKRLPFGWRSERTAYRLCAC
jgi:hypothetical protein